MPVGLAAHLVGVLVGMDVNLIVQQQYFGLHGKHGGQGNQAFFAAGQLVGDAVFEIVRP